MGVLKQTAFFKGILNHLILECFLRALGKCRCWICSHTLVHFVQTSHHGTYHHGTRTSEMCQIIINESIPWHSSAESCLTILTFSSHQFDKIFVKRSMFDATYTLFQQTKEMTRAPVSLNRSSWSSTQTRLRPRRTHPGHF